MKIVMNTVYADGQQCLRPGDEAEFPTEQARELIAGNYAFDPVAREKAAAAELEAKRQAKAAAATGGDDATASANTGKRKAARG